MDSKKLKYTSWSLKLFMFKVALLLSVFAFSGFNLQIHSKLQQANQSELVESRSDTSIKTVNDFNHQFWNFLNIKGAQTYNYWALLHFNHLLETAYKVNYQRLSDLDSFHARFYFNQVPSNSEEIILPLFLS